MEWRQEEPNTLEVKWQDRPKEYYRTGFDYLSPAARGSARTPSGHPQGYLEAFANLYANFAKAVSVYKPGRPFDKLRAGAGGEDFDFPTVDDGVRGMAFIEAAVASSKAKQKWTPLTR